jgi:hypothetical protein
LGNLVPKPFSANCLNRYRYSYYCFWNYRPEAEGYIKMAYSEDALFKALLKNKPPQPTKPMAVPVKKELSRSVPLPVEAIPEPVIEKFIPPPPKIDLEPITDSIDRLNATLYQIHGTIKTIIVPILVLILVVAIGILILSKSPV